MSILLENQNGSERTRVSTLHLWAVVAVGSIPLSWALSAPTSCIWCLIAKASSTLLGAQFWMLFTVGFCFYLSISICCPTYSYIHWLILAYALTRDQTFVLGQCSNQLSTWSGLFTLLVARYSGPSSKHWPQTQAPWCSLSHHCNTFWCLHTWACPLAPSQNPEEAGESDVPALPFPGETPLKRSTQAMSPGTVLHVGRYAAYGRTCEHPVMQTNPVLLFVF